VQCQSGNAVICCVARRNARSKPSGFNSDAAFVERVEQQTEVLDLSWAKRTRAAAMAAKCRHHDA
jgi:hypothetical protein